MARHPPNLKMVKVTLTVARHPPNLKTVKVTLTVAPTQPKDGQSETDTGIAPTQPKDGQMRLAAAFGSVHKLSWQKVEAGRSPGCQRSLALGK